MSLLFSTASYATVYMQTDADGNIAYSDTPSENSQVINLPDADSSSSSVQTSPQLNNKEEEKTTTTITTEQTLTNSYKSFSIISPKDQENIQNQPGLVVDVKVEPKLKKGDKILLLLDNKPVGNPTAGTHIETGPIDRGTHQLSAIIVGQNEQVLQQTNPITIYINHVNVNFKPGGNTSSSTSPATEPAPAPENRIIERIKRLFS